MTAPGILSRLAGEATLARMSRSRVVVAIAYGALALVVLRWPWAALGRAIPAGTEPCDTVPFALAWAIGWNLRRIDAALGDAAAGGYWDAPIFHPEAGAFALSEPMPLVGALVWPAHACGVSLAGCVVIAVVVLLVLAAVAMRRLLLRLGVCPPIATALGAVAMLLPFVHQELGVLPLVGTFGPTWMLAALVGVLIGPRAGTWRRGLELGLATVASWWVCEQLTLFTALLLGPCALCLLRTHALGRRLALALALAAAIGAAGVLPGALAQRSILVGLELERSQSSHARGAARLGQLVRVPWDGPWPLPDAMVAGRTSARAFFPGPVRVLGAVIGAVEGIRRSARRRIAIMLVVLVVLSCALALGPAAPIEWLADHVPGIAHVRGLFRAVALAQIGALALAAIGVRALQVRVRARRGRHRWWIAVAVIAMIVELWPPAPRWSALPAPDAAWIAWLRDVAEPDAPVAYVPFAASGDVCDHEATARAMVDSLAHGHPLVNGYSSFFPAEYRRIARAARTLPSGRGLVGLRRAATRYVVSPEGGPLDQLTPERAHELGVRRELHDASANVTIFAIE